VKARPGLTFPHDGRFCLGDSDGSVAYDIDMPILGLAEYPIPGSAEYPIPGSAE